MKREQEEEEEISGFSWTNHLIPFPGSNLLPLRYPQLLYLLLLIRSDRMRGNSESTCLGCETLSRADLIENEVAQPSFTGQKTVSQSKSEVTSEKRVHVNGSQKLLFM